MQSSPHIYSPTPSYHLITEGCFYVEMPSYTGKRYNKDQNN